MAAANCTWTMNTGETLSVYFNGDAVGASPAVSQHGTASAANSPDFKFARNCCLADKINGTSTGAICEVYNVDEARRTGKYISGATLAVTVAQRPIERVCFRGGVTYRLIMVVAQS